MVRLRAVTLRFTHHDEFLLGFATMTYPYTRALALKQADADIPAQPTDGIGTHAGGAVAGCGDVGFEAGLE